MITLEKINEQIQSLYPKYVDLWVKLCNIESPSNYKAGVDQVGNTILEFTKDFGLKTEIIKLENCGNPIFLTLKGNKNNPPVCLTAHMDTVFPVGSLQKSPTKIEGDVLYALGSADCKGGIVSCLMSLEVIKNLGVLDKDVILLFNSEEENNGFNSNKKAINAICEKAKNSVACFNLEMNRIKHGLCLERKGILSVKVFVYGVDAHAGFCYTAGASAILEASRKIIELEKYKEENGITFNCGKICGGTKSNVVPKYCEFELDIRFFSQEQKTHAINILKDIVENSYIKGTNSSFEITTSREPMSYSEKNYDLLNKINAIYKEYGIKPYTSHKTSGGSDSGELTFYGIPTIDCFRVKGANIHNEKEYAILSSLKDSVRRIVLATINL